MGRFYTQAGIKTMLNKLKDSPDEVREAFKKYVMKYETGGMDEEAFIYIIENAHLSTDIFDSFDSAVEEKFIRYFERTFMNDAFMKDFNK